MRWLPVIDQLATVAACDVLVSPHSGFGMAARAVGTPWLSIAGNRWPEHRGSRPGAYPSATGTVAAFMLLSCARSWTGESSVPTPAHFSGRSAAIWAEAGLGTRQTLRPILSIRAR